MTRKAEASGRPLAVVTARLRELAPHLRSGGRPLALTGPGRAEAAAELADQLGMVLHRVDTAQLVSRYVGETERNLTAVFEAAEAAGAVLLFDEADALFGQRGEVRDSHDRHANAAIGPLLRALENHRGPVVFASETPLGPELTGATEVTAPAPAAGPALTRGEVAGLDDPQGLGRVQLLVPAVFGEMAVWAQALRAEGRGLSVGEAVLVGFIDDDPDQPVVLGPLNG